MDDRVEIGESLGSSKTSRDRRAIKQPSGATRRLRSAPRPSHKPLARLDHLAALVGINHSSRPTRSQRRWTSPSDPPSAMTIMWCLEPEPCPATLACLPGRDMGATLTAVAPTSREPPGTPPIRHRLPVREALLPVTAFAQPGVSLSWDAEPPGLVPTRCSWYSLPRQVQVSKDSRRVLDGEHGVSIECLVVVAMGSPNDNPRRTRLSTYRLGVHE